MAGPGRAALGREGRCSRFHVPETAVEGGQLDAQVDDLDVDRAAPRPPETLLRGLDQRPASALAVLGRIHGEQPEIAAVTALLDVDAADGRAVLVGEEESALLHVGPDLVLVRAIALDEETLHLEGGVDEGGERARVGGGGGAQRGHERGGREPVSASPRLTTSPGGSSSTRYWNSRQNSSRERPAVAANLASSCASSKSSRRRRIMYRRAIA